MNLETLAFTDDHRTHALILAGVWLLVFGLIALIINKSKRQNYLAFTLPWGLAPMFFVGCMHLAGMGASASHWYAQTPLAQNVEYRSTLEAEDINAAVEAVYGGQVVNVHTVSGWNSSQDFYTVKFEDSTVRECTINTVGEGTPQGQEAVLLCNGVEPKRVG